MTRADAYARLVEHLEAHPKAHDSSWVMRAWHAKARRLIRALLVERAYQAATTTSESCDVAYKAGRGKQVFFHDGARNLVMEAVLRRPQTRRGK